MCYQALNVNSVISSFSMKVATTFLDQISGSDLISHVANCKHHVGSLSVNSASAAALTSLFESQLLGSTLKLPFIRVNVGDMLMCMLVLTLVAELQIMKTYSK